MFSSKNIVAIDIGSNKIKIVTGQKNRNSLSVKKVSIIDTPEFSIVDGVIQDRVALINALDGEVGRLSLRNYHVNLVLSTSKVILRKIESPKLNPKEIRNFINIEAEQYVPGDIKNYIIDYMNLEEKKDEEGQKQIFTLVACPRNIVDTYVEVMGILGLRLESIDVNGNCIIRLADHIRKNSKRKYIDIKKTTAIIDIGYEGTKVVIEHNGSLEADRLISRPGYSLSQVLARTYNTTLDNISDHIDIWQSQYDSEVDEIASTMIGYGEEDSVLNAENIGDFPLLNNIKSSLDELLREVMIVFNFYISRNNGNAIDAIYITGGGAELKGIDKYISNYFSIPCYDLGLEQIISGKESKKIIKENEVYLANALGLMLRSQKQEVNLLPQHLKKTSLNGLVSVAALFMIIVISAGAAAGYIIPKAQHLRIIKQNQAIVNQIEGLKDVEQRVAELNQRKQDIIKTSEIIANIDKDSVSIVDLLLDAAMAMPKEITLSQYNKSENTITLRGLAESYAHISYFIYNLENKIGVSNINLSSISNDGGALKFQLSYDINR